MIKTYFLSPDDMSYTTRGLVAFLRRAHTTKRYGRREGGRPNFHIDCKASIFLPLRTSIANT